MIYLDLVTRKQRDATENGVFIVQPLDSMAKTVIFQLLNLLSQIFDAVFRTAAVELS